MSNHRLLEILFSERVIESERERGREREKGRGGQREIRGMIPMYFSVAYFTAFLLSMKEFILNDQMKKNC